MEKEKEKDGKRKETEKGQEENTKKIGRKEVG